MNLLSPHCGERMFGLLNYVLGISYLTDRQKVALVRWYLVLVSMSEFWSRQEEKEVRLRFPKTLLEQYMEMSGRRFSEYVIDVYCAKRVVRLRIKNGEPHAIYIKIPLFHKDKGMVKVCDRRIVRIKAMAQGFENSFWRLAAILVPFAKVSVKRGVCLHGSCDRAPFQVWSNVAIPEEELVGLGRDVDALKTFAREARSGTKRLAWLEIDCGSEEEFYEKLAAIVEVDRENGPALFELIRSIFNGPSSETQASGTEASK